MSIKPMISKVVLSSAGMAAFKKNGTILRKDYIRVGNWNVPGQGTLPVTKERMQKWADTYKLFRERGNSVPLTVDHIEVFDPITKQNKVLRANSNMAEAKRGDVVDLDAEGMFNVVPSDPESEKLMERCPEVSLELTRDFEDGHGNFYDEAITAITLTPKPVIPGQQQWQRVAASRSEDGTTVYLSAEPITETPPVAKPLETMTMTPEQITKARTLCSLSAIVEDKDVPDMLFKHIEKQNSEIVGAKESVTKLSRDVSAAQAAATAAGQAIVLDEDAADMMASAITTRINALEVKTTPAQRTLLLSLLCGTPNARPAICLSRKAAEKVGLSAALANTVLEIFEAGDPAEMAKLLADQSKAQKRTVLAREGSGNASENFDQRVHDEMVASIKNQGAASAQPLTL